MRIEWHFLYFFPWAEKMCLLTLFVGVSCGPSNVTWSFLPSSLCVLIYFCSSWFNIPWKSSDDISRRVVPGNHVLSPRGTWCFSDPYFSWTDPYELCKMPGARWKSRVVEPILVDFLIPHFWRAFPIQLISYRSEKSLILTVIMWRHGALSNRGENTKIVTKSFQLMIDILLLNNRKQSTCDLIHVYWWIEKERYVTEWGFIM